MTGIHLTAIDLFAGVGGLSTGLIQSGFIVCAAVEIDPISASSFLQNHVHTRVLIRDIRKISGVELLKRAGLARGELDLLTGCPPCQGYSTLRTRRQRRVVTDPRNDLIFDILRLVRSTRPRAVLLENVPGLAQDRRFSDFRHGLAAAGYESEYKVVDASDYGVPQRRRRLVLMAIRDGTVPTEWWSPSSTTQRTVRDAIAMLPAAGHSGDVLHDVTESRSATVMERIRATPHNGGSRSSVRADYSLACHERTDGFSDVYGRMKWDAPAPTITGGCSNPSKGRFLHPVEDRAITLREAALLQSFPADYQFDLRRGKEHAAWQIGNAFPPQMIVPIARALYAALVAT